MKTLELPGGHQAPSGVYREVHSGHVVYIHGTSQASVLPGSPNSDTYVPIRMERVLKLPCVRNEQA